MDGSWLDSIRNKSTNKERWQYGMTSSINGHGQVVCVDSNNDGKLEIDCSHLLHKILGEIGFNISRAGIPYLQTYELNDKSKALKYFYDVPESKVVKGDVVVFKGHVAFVNDYAKDNPDEGDFFGSNGKNLGDRGPSICSFEYFRKPTKFLRPRPEFFLGKPEDNPYYDPNYKPPVSLKFPIQKLDTKKVAEKKWNNPASTDFDKEQMHKLHKMEQRLLSLENRVLRKPCLDIARLATTTARGSYVKALQWEQNSLRYFRRALRNSRRKFEGKRECFGYF